MQVGQSDPVAQNNNYGLGSQNLNHGRDQNILTGTGHLFTGNVVIASRFTQTLDTSRSYGEPYTLIVRRNIAQYADDVVSHAAGHEKLWNMIAGVGASHKAEQQFSRGHCLAGTRTMALKQIHEWRTAKVQGSPPMCWLSGTAGVGKSAVAMTIAQSCEEDLVSSFFFFRTDTRRNNASALMLSIAHDLSVSSTPIRTLLNQRISDDPTILEATLEEQFVELVLKPSLSGLESQSPMLIIIDGLDECKDVEAQRRILRAISSPYRQIPWTPLRFLICSRPESWIGQEFDALPLRRLTKRILLDVAFNFLADIKRYLEHEFKRIVSDPRFSQVQFPDPWPTDQVLECLARRSCGQFSYAKTVVKYVELDYFHPLEQLSRVLDNRSDSHESSSSSPSPSLSPFHELDVLYHTILTLAHPDYDQIRCILSAVILLPDYIPAIPLSPVFIELLLGLLPGTLTITLRAMHAILRIRGKDDRIRVYHTSFVDFLLDKSRSGRFYIDKSREHHALVQSWLKALSHSKINHQR
ncbi:hypothetical protein PQX77_012218 [Marasmius sp. AFHP31]|nr:hypothetical protein PQX77_012218 [Marasmius sp. AFHP31]